jgi:hypothetical protein
MLEKYAIEVNDRTQALCTFLNDGVHLDVQDPITVLVCTINGPREITTKLKRYSEPFNDEGELEADYIVLK